MVSDIMSKQNPYILPDHLTFHHGRGGGGGGGGDDVMCGHLLDAESG